jgi:hypothetical protein
MDIRYQPGQPVNVSVLFPNESLTGRILDLSGRHAAIRLDRPLASGAPLRLDFDDSVIWGEVGSCRPAKEGVEVKFIVREAVPMLSDLGRLVSALMAEDNKTVSSMNQTNPVASPNAR